MDYVTLLLVNDSIYIHFQINLCCLSFQIIKSNLALLILSELVDDKIMNAMLFSIYFIT